MLDQRMSDLSALTTVWQSTADNSMSFIDDQLLSQFPSAVLCFVLHCDAAEPTVRERVCVNWLSSFTRCESRAHLSGTHVEDWCNKNILEGFAIRFYCATVCTSLCSEKCKLPPRPKFQPKVIGNSNLDFQIDPNVCHIAPEMLWIYSLLSVSHFAMYCK